MGLGRKHAAVILTMMAVNTATSEAKTCTTTRRQDVDNYGPGISEAAVHLSTPFEVGQYNAIIAFDADHCVQMCCEQDECALVVFNEVEAVCYLKSTDALASREVPATGISTYTIVTREGTAEPMELLPTYCNDKGGVSFGFQETEDLYTLKDGISWWYDWSPGSLADGIFEASLAQGSIYVPMIWGEQDLSEERLRDLAWVGDSSPYLLGFNEPNFGSQANLTPQQAAALWPVVRQQAEAFGMELVSPALNYCYGDCNEEDPIEWLDQFFNSCGNVEERDFCGISRIALHSYACEVKYLNKHIHTYVRRYNLPIWLTEFACGFQATVLNEEGQAHYLGAALTYLELNPHVERYAWFTAISSDHDGIDNSVNLLDRETKNLTAVGEVFVSDYSSLQHCMAVDSTVTSTAGSILVGGTDDGGYDDDDDAYDDDAYSDIIDDDDSADQGGIRTGTDDISATTPTPEPSSVEIIFTPPTADGTAEDLDVDPDATVIVNAVITNVGGVGHYDDVVNMIDGENMECPSYDDTCIKEQVCVSGDLAPFDEVSVAFRGPLNLYNIVWYEGAAEETLTRTTSWTPGTFGENIAFMNNRGAVGGCAGVWSICGGNGQSFSDETGTSCASEMTAFDGNLPNDNEVNIMTGWGCASREQCGFYRDVGMRGWTGGKDGTKVMIFELDMPHCEGDSCTWDRPAVWALNAKVMRTAQYGCNCRGSGANGGCGEFDVLEAIVGNEYSDMLFTHVYDFKGVASPGTAKYFKRPSGKTTYAAIFRGGDDPYLQVAQLLDWDFTAISLTHAQLDEMKGTEEETHAIYSTRDSSAVELQSCKPPEEETIVNLPDLVLADGYEYIGCFHDKNPLKNRDMPLKSKEIISFNTPEKCANHCATEDGAAFFGLQKGEQCWCGGMGDTGPGSYGQANNCDYPCPGAENIACGAQKVSSVYVLPVEHAYVGCFDDKENDHDLFLVPRVTSSYLTPAVCAAYCSSVEGATYIGVQAGSMCFCGDSFGKHGESNQCAEPCSGDEDQVCGASNVNSVYKLLSAEEVNRIHVDEELRDQKSACVGKSCGCFLSKSLDEDSLLHGDKKADSEELSRASCREMCEEEDFPFYGLEWSILCYCGGKQVAREEFIEGIHEFQLADATGACSMPCPAGDREDTCGGPGAIEIWEV